jgi:polyisoprenoid-binding protein YceI
MTGLPRPSLVLALLVALLLGGGAPPTHAQRVVAPVDSTASVIDYTGSAVMHDWTGTSRDVAGTLALDLDAPDSSHVALRAPVASFDSGNDRRDANMREVTEAEAHPLVQFRATDIRPVRWGRSRNGHSGRWAVTGDLTFHGQTHPVEATVDVRVTDDSVRARTQFPVSLSRFGVERPSLLWVAPIADTIRIDARIAGAARAMAPPTARLDVERGGEPEGPRLASSDIRDVAASGYAGRDPGLRAQARPDAEGGGEWTLLLYGFSDQPADLSSSSSVQLRADREPVPVQGVERDTRRLDDGTILEISRVSLSRSAFASVAHATTASVSVGASTFSLGWPPRRDLRLILDAASSPGRLSFDEDS